MIQVFERISVIYLKHDTLNIICIPSFSVLVNYIQLCCEKNVVLMKRFIFISLLENLCRVLYELITNHSKIIRAKIRQNI